MVDMEDQQVHIVDMVLIEDPAPVGIEHMEASSVQEDMETPIGDNSIDLDFNENCNQEKVLLYCI